MKKNLATYLLLALMPAYCADNAANKASDRVCKGDCTAGVKHPKVVCFSPEGGYTGSKLFARTDWIRVAICNAPTGTQFRVVIDESVVDESTLSQVGGIIGVNLPSPSPSDNADAANENAAKTMSGAASPEVSNAEQNAARQQNVLHTLDTQFQPIRKDIDNFQQSVSRSAERKNAQQLLNDLKSVDGLQVNAGFKNITFSGPQNRSALPDTARQLLDLNRDFQASSMSNALSLTVSSNTNLSEMQKSALAFETIHAPQHDADVSTASAKIAQYAAFIADIPALTARLTKIVNDATSDQDSCQVLGTILPDWHEARTVAVKLQKATAAATADQPATYSDVTSVTLTLGQPLFAFSAGFAVSPLAKISYQSLGATSGTSTSGNGTIGYSENSSTRVQPMAFLDASLIDGTTSWLHGSLHMTAGFTLTSGQLSTNPEFLFGPSLSFLKEQLFITVGAYGGFQQALQAGYTIGSAAPGGSIPTLNQFHWKPGFAISWRVASASKANNPSKNSTTQNQTNTTEKSAT